MKRPLPDSEEYERRVREERVRRFVRITVFVLLLPAIALAVFLLAGGQLPEPLDALIQATGGAGE